MLFCFIFCFIHSVLFRPVNEQICLCEFFYLLVFHKAETREIGKFRSVLLSLNVKRKRDKNIDFCINFIFKTCF